MNKLVIYDSLYGNTKKAAEVIATVLVTRVLAAEKAKLTDIESADLLVIGSPTHGGQPKASLLKFLNELPAGSLANKKVAIFDTRMEIKEQKMFLRWLMKLIGYAALKLEKIVVAKGGELISPSLGLIVSDRIGPLKVKELERAEGWAKKML